MNIINIKVNEYLEYSFVIQNIKSIVLNLESNTSWFNINEIHIFLHIGSYSSIAKQIYKKIYNIVLECIKNEIDCTIDVKNIIKDYK